MRAAMRVAAASKKRCCRCASPAVVANRGCPSSAAVTNIDSPLSLHRYWEVTHDVELADYTLTFGGSGGRAVA